MRPIRRLLSRSPKWLAAVLIATLSIQTQTGCQKPAAPPPPPPPTVGVVESRLMNVPVVSTPNGTTRALQEVTIRARVRGFLTESHFKEGSMVKKGQLLFVIDEEQYKVALQSAKAGQAEAEASLAKAEQSKVREVNAAQLSLGQAQLLLAQIQERRARTLLSRNAGSREDLDRTEAERQKWDAEVEAAKANLAQAKVDYEVGIAAAKAQVEAARASVRDAELNLEYCRMSAPIDGRIGEAKVKVGNLVGPAAAAGGTYTELATIQQLDPMGVDIQVSSRYLDRATELINQGLTIRLFRPSLEGKQEHSEEGVVYFIDNMVDPTTGTFLSKARVPNPEGTLLPGEYVNLMVVVDRLNNAVVVPAQAVMETEAGPVVYFVDDQDKVAVQRVEAAQTYEGLRVIVDGLDAGVPVIVEGLQLIRPGVPVKVEPAVLPQPAHDESEDAATSRPAEDAAPKPDAAKSDAPRKKDEASRPDRSVVRPGGPRSAVVEEQNVGRAGQPAQRAGTPSK